MVGRGKNHFVRKSHIFISKFWVSGKFEKKYTSRLKWLKIDGCMHPLLKIDWCSCTLCTRYFKGPVIDIRLSRLRNMLTLKILISNISIMTNWRLVRDYDISTCNACIALNQNERSMDRCQIVYLFKDTFNIENSFTFIRIYTSQ